MRGVFNKGKIEHQIESYPCLTRGNWKTEFSEVSRDMTPKIQYLDYIADFIPVEGQEYVFEIENGKAKLLSR